MARIPRVFRPGLQATAESHRVTVVELFFDLVFVFAFTQVTDYMLESGSAVGVAQGIVFLGLLWWSWVSYSWLANQTRVDRGLARTGMAVAMTAVFVVAVAFPEVLEDRDGDLSGPIVLAAAYLIVRYTQVVIALLAVRSDEGLRREVLLGSIPTAAGSLFVIAGVALGGPFHTWLWLIGLAVDIGLTFSLRTRDHLRIHSPSHWIERYSCVILLALGESIVSAGIAATAVPIGTQILAACIVAMVLAASFWAAYYLPDPDRAERALTSRSGRARTAFATEAYAYLHFPMIVGIIFSALGVQTLIDHLVTRMPLQPFGAIALFSGVALFLSGHAAYWRRIDGSWRIWQLGGAVVLLTLVPVALVIGTLPALTLVTLVTVAALLVQNLSGRANTS